MVQIRWLMRTPDNYFALLQVLDAKNEIVEILMKSFETGLSSNVGFALYPSQQLRCMSQSYPTAGDVLT